MKKARYGIDDNPIFVIDQSRCIGCEACVQACEECGTHRGQSLIHLERIDRAASTQTAPMVCMHCEDPTCANVSGSAWMAVWWWPGSLVEVR